MENNKNFILAIALSLAVLIGWQFLYMGPAQKARQQAIEAAQKAETQTAKTETQTHERTGVIAFALRAGSLHACGSLCVA